MSDNDRILLDREFDNFLGARPEIADRGYAFELFTAMQILKGQYDLDEDEILDGLTRSELGNGGGDGGMDSVYGFAGTTLIREDTLPSRISPESTMQFVIIQTKEAPGFNESAMQALRQSAKDLFDLGLDNRTATGQKYNEIVRKKFARYRDFIKKVNPKSIGFKYYYVTRGDEVHPSVFALEREVREAISDHFSHATFLFRFVTAADLLGLVHSSKDEIVSLPYFDMANSTRDNGYVAFVKLIDYYKMISSDGELRPRLFEANVRDYQGENDVNNAIRKSLSNHDGEDFWVLNNGVSIVADAAEVRQRSFRLTNPRIVNGLQTSKEIHKHFSAFAESQDDARLVLVRVVVPETDQGRNHIIYSTNSQTRIPQANLRATDEFHSKIETYFLERDLYYDRRKNYYRLQGKKAAQIVSIVFLAQAITSIVLRNPSVARARPSTIFRNDEQYYEVFKPSRALDEYLACALALLQSRKGVAAANLDPKVKNNIRFHVALCYTRLKQNAKKKPSNMSSSEYLELDDKLMRESISLVTREFSRLVSASSSKNEDQVGKSAAFDKAVIAKTRPSVRAKPAKSPLTDRRR